MGDNCFPARNWPEKALSTQGMLPFVAVEQLLKKQPVAGLLPEIQEVREAQYYVNKSAS